ncbi:MAG: geranylgeranyl reductase family protein [Bacteroidales bacterium]|nr:geranylgeranyl reductase family protein [Bacteroidales bacterium]
MKSDFDVIISGAGPAGCTAALALGSSGLSVALIEKERFPREKVCGDAIPAYVPKVLGTIDPSFRAALEEIEDKQPVSICRYVAPDRTALDIAFRENGMVCRRPVFDSFLLKLASGLDNLTIFTGKLIKNIRTGSKGVAVSTGNGEEITARLLIGCDGSTGVSKRILAPSIHEPSEGSVAVRAYFSGIKDNPHETLEFHFLKDLLPGYFWIFPLPGNEFNAGIGMPSAIVTSRKLNLRDTMMKIIETDPVIGLRFSGASMKGNIKGYYLPLFTRKRKISGERFMLCGDAASLVNPATGAGIGQAMQSGRYAGWQAAECFRKNDFSDEFMKSYDLTLYGKLWRSNRNYMIIRNLVLKNPAVLNLASRAGNSNRYIRKALAEKL